LDAARQANEEGRSGDAQDAIDDARQLLDEANQFLRGAASSLENLRRQLQSRPRRQCIDDDTTIGPWLRSFVDFGIVDIAVAPSTTTPEQWTRSLANGRSAINAVEVFSDIATVLQAAPGAVANLATKGIWTALAGAGADVVVDMAFSGFGVAGDLLNAWINIFQSSLPHTIHIRTIGAHVETRATWICVDGLWEGPEIESVMDPTPVYRTYQIGPIMGSTEEERREAVEEALNRWVRMKGLAP
jgi:hypothetical protein